MCPYTRFFYSSSITRIRRAVLHFFFERSGDLSELKHVVCLTKALKVKHQRPQALCCLEGAERSCMSTKARAHFSDSHQHLVAIWSEAPRSFERDGGVSVSGLKVLVATSV